jgi:hypothetical protein
MEPSRDNAAIITKILKLRNEQAALHGYTNYADYSTEDSMAQKTSAVMELLEQVFDLYNATTYSVFTPLTVLNLPMNCHRTTESKLNSNVAIASLVSS